MILWVAIFWAVCGFITTGITFAYFQRRYPELASDQWQEDLGHAIVFGLLGPIGLVVSFFLSGFCKHGWTLLPPKEPK